MTIGMEAVRDGGSRPPGREDLRQAGRIAMGEAPFNCELLALDVAEIAQRLGQELRGR